MLVLSFNSVLIIAGIVVGPSVLGWARVDAPVQVLAQLGLGMLLFLAGLEIDVDRLRSPLARLRRSIEISVSRRAFFKSWKKAASPASAA